MTAIPTWFGSAERPLFGWAHVPEFGRAAGAVVLCPPLARELAATQTTYRRLAETLAEHGILAVRFDYDGTGESVGEDLDPNRLEAWLDGAHHAIELARSMGAQTVSLVGMRVGALLAAIAAKRDGEIDGVVLWDPIGGRAFLRSEGALRRLNFEDPIDPDVGAEVPGFLFSEAAVAELNGLKVPADGMAPRRALLLTRPGQQPMPELAEALGSPAELGSAEGQETLLEVEPGSRQIPAETVGAIVEWCVNSGAASEAISITPKETVSIPFDGQVVTERVVRLGPAELFGILTEADPLEGTPAVIMLNAGLDHHVGPNRLWVELSRRWALAGFRCVRLDHSGLGDSAPRPGKKRNVIRSPEAFDDVTESAAALEPDDPSNVVLLGLCSGGYQALESALLQPVRAAYAINPTLHFTPPEMADGPMDPRRRICWPARSFVSAYRVLMIEPVRRRLRKAIWWALHLFNRDPDRDPSGWLDQLRSDGVEVLVVCGEDEARPFGTEAESSSVRELGDPIRIDLISHLDGALMPAVQRREVARRLTDHLVTHFASHRAPSASRRDTA